MSADNFVGVRDNEDGTWSVFEYGNASVDGEDCQYLAGEQGEIFNSRSDALVRAHNLVKAMYVCEYGVVEMKKPGDPCGKCFTCVHERSIVADDIQRCDLCTKPIVQGDWMVSWYDTHTITSVTVHRQCEAEMKEKLSKA